jgi:hypothetical protein
MAFKLGNSAGKATRFKPGQSGNPAGNSYSHHKRITDEACQQLEASGDYAELARVWIKRAKAGDYRFFRELLDRVEGPLVRELSTMDEDFLMDLVKTAERQANGRKRTRKNGAD